MTKIDFYILPQDDIRQRHLFACRLAEKAYKLGHPIYIHSDDEAQARALDDLLWRFRDSSFIPHSLLSSSQEPGASCGDAVQIGYAETIDTAHAADGLLINLSNTVPEFFSRFERVSEVVVQQPHILESTRANYRFYKDRGYQLTSHDLSKRSSDTPTAPRHE